MATDVSERVHEIAKYRDSDESWVIQQAVEKGVDELWRDVVVAKYLDGDISRRQAVEELGQEYVRRVDQAETAIEEDVRWGLGEGEGEA